MAKTNTRLSPYNTHELSHSAVVRRMTLFVGGLGVLLAFLSGMIVDEKELKIKLISGNTFLIDNNKDCDIAPHTAYVGFEICNISGEILTDLHVTFGDFSNPSFGLSENQSAFQSIDQLAVGECMDLFWHTDYDCSQSEARSDITITLSDQQGKVVSRTETFITKSTVDAGLKKSTVH